MGGGTSKFDVTDWSKSSGGLESTDETIDGAPPTSHFQIFHLIKRGMTNQREFDIVDPSNNNMIRYTTRSVPGTLAWFDVLGPNEHCGNTSHPVLLLRVQVDLPRRTWTVFRYYEPVFPGQQPARLEPRLFKTACITVSWSRYVAVAARYGAPSIEYMFHLEPDPCYEEGKENETFIITNDDTAEEEDLTNELNSISNSIHRFQNSSSQNMENRHDIYELKSSDSQDELFAAAEIVAARRRNNTGNVVNDDGPDQSSQTSLTTRSVPIDANSSKSKQAKRMITNAVNSCTCPTNSETDSPESSLHHPAAFDQKVAVAMLSAKRTDPLGNPIDASSYTSSTKASLRQYLSSRIFGSYDDVAKAADSNSRSTPQQWANREERRKEAYRQAMEGVIDLNGPMVECQEIYNKIIGNHQTSLIGKDQVRRLLQWDEAQHARDSDDPKNTDEHNPFVQAVQNADDSHQATSRTTSDDWMTRVGQGMTSLGLTCDADVTMTPRPQGRSPSQTLPPPPPQLQLPPQPSPPKSPSLYSKNEFEESLSTIVEKQQNHTSWLGGFGSPKSTKHKATRRSESGSAAAEVTRSLQEAAEAGRSPGSQKSMDADAVGQNRPPELTPVEQSADEVEPPLNSVQPSAQLAEMGAKQPLVGYWSWKNSYTVHKMELHLAKGSDLALHIVLAILSNQVRTERNALAMTV